jgi:hypothetical protein
VTSPKQAESQFEPPVPLLVAVVVFILAALSLMYPMLSGKIVGGSDQIMVGYALRDFAAQSMQQSGHIPQWNPFIFGGMPLWEVPGHFDVFYPTAWLRWFLRADLVLTLSFFIHLVVAGIAMYSARCEPAGRRRSPRAWRTSFPVSWPRSSVPGTMASSSPPHLCRLHSQR